MHLAGKNGNSQENVNQSVKKWLTAIVYKTLQYHITCQVILLVIVHTHTHTCQTLITGKHAHGAVHSERKMINHSHFVAVSAWVCNITGKPIHTKCLPCISSTRTHKEEATLRYRKTHRELVMLCVIGCKWPVHADYRLPTHHTQQLSCSATLHPTAKFPSTFIV